MARLCRYRSLTNYDGVHKRCTVHACPNYVLRHAARGGACLLHGCPGPRPDAARHSTATGHLAAAAPHQPLQRHQHQHRRRRRRRRVSDGSRPNSAAGPAQHPVVGRLAACLAQTRVRPALAPHVRRCPVSCATAPLKPWPHTAETVALTRPAPALGTGGFPGAPPGRRAGRTGRPR